MRGEGRLEDGQDESEGRVKRMRTRGELSRE